jgi:phosphoglycolate phosphatase-like HAD superfamily hydrolase
LSNFIIFDLDGVITSEEAYWDTAGLVLHELLFSPRYWNIGGAQSYEPVQTAEESRRLSRRTFPEKVIVGFKARSVNSNWDTCYAGFCLYLIELLSLIPARERAELFPLQPERADWIAAFRQRLTSVRVEEIGQVMLRPLDTEVFQGINGVELLRRFNTLASEVLGQPVEDVFARYSPSWLFCQDRFQEWYLGEKLYTQSYGHAPAQPGKPGCIQFEEPLLPIEQIRATLEMLHKQGYQLGVATGRPGQEAIVPLKNYGIFHYFDEQHVVTDAEVVRAEERLRAQGIITSLIKPNPYPFLVAANPLYQPGEPLPPRGSFVVVGDTTSDIQGARAAGALSIAVLTGARTDEARRLLEQSHPHFIVDNMTRVPALMEYLDTLSTIQRLQFDEREKAELLLQRWFARHMDLQVESVMLRPKAVSLNSFNGFYQVDGEEYFFKTHVEEQGVLEEYYNAEALYNAGYHIVRPLRTLREQGQQMVIYPVVRWPVMFDLMREVETGQLPLPMIETLALAEQRECERLLDIYRSTCRSSTAEEHARAPIHQLFWHRLTGERLKSFYAGKSITIPGTPDTQISFEQISQYRWRVNGTFLPYTLGMLIERAKELLYPARANMTTVIGHGDAHFGNVFLEQEREYLYFDPAFAGRHSPLLDVVKPLFHNIFATWMYFPYEFERDCNLDIRIDDANERIEVSYPFKLPPVREAILHTKVEYLLKPLLSWLRSSNALPADWTAFTRSALLCCPLLTVNLFEHERMPATISWLGLTYAVLMGNNGLETWKVGVEL